MWLWRRVALPEYQTVTEDKPTHNPDPGTVHVLQLWQHGYTPIWCRSAIAAGSTEVPAVAHPWEIDAEDHG
ncbi:MAG: hypothetical protein QNJ14_12135 [Woeseiaceae bacterium]|nr:hypothetical protein [Woeseiaceae bacterium]